MSDKKDTQIDRIAEIVKAKGAVPEGTDPFAFCMGILPLLGTTDGKLREWRVYGILYLWTTRREMSNDQLRELLWTIADEEHLFHGIGENGTDTAYMRAFSVLVLAGFVEAHRAEAYLSTEDLRRLTDTVLRYLDAEKDLRGYVSDETFWAHATAHAADTLGELARCDELGVDDLRSILDGLGRKVVTGQTVWQHEEDGRAATAMIHSLKREVLSGSEIERWLSSLVPEARFEGELPGTHWRYVNARNLLRCLLHQGEAEGLPEAILMAIRAAHGRLPER